MIKTTRARDKRIINEQEKLVACLSTVSKSISDLLSRKLPEDLSIIEALSDAARLMADAMHDVNSQKFHSGEYE